MPMDHRWGRREAVDIAVHLIAQLSVVGRGRMSNLSLTGAYLETDVRLRPLSIVFLEPAWSSASPGFDCSVAASVIRIDAGGLGLEWLDDSAYARIQQLFRARTELVGVAAKNRTGSGRAGEGALSAK